MEYSITNIIRVNGIHVHKQVFYFVVNVKDANVAVFANTPAHCDLWIEAATTREKKTYNKSILYVDDLIVMYSKHFIQNS